MAPISSSQRRSTPAYVTRELSAQTLGDFEALFSRGNGWDHCTCMYFQRGGAAPNCRTRAEARARNLADKRELVATGHVHGILVYAGADPIGWCQFGPADELPMPGRPPRPTAQPGTDWRITCFVTDKAHRMQGVARLALSAALKSIAKAGGGSVEAYPVVQGKPDAELRALIRVYGRESHEVRRYLRVKKLATVAIDGVGDVAVARGSFGFNSTQGTVSMFSREDFRAVGLVTGGFAAAGIALSPPGAVHVRMRRLVTRLR